MSDDFESALLTTIAPRLHPLGYEYDGRRRVEDELFVFHKPLDNTVQALIQFQRRGNSEADDFTVNLIRAPAGAIQPQLQDNAASVSAARLGYVLWYVHSLRDYPASDFWWTASDAARREIALLDAAAMIERYGVPWLESPAAHKPWEMPAQRGDDFSMAVQAVMTSEMARLGYHLERQSLPGSQPYWYFGKAMPDGTFALIELQPIYSLDPSVFNFDVRLQRRQDSDPLESKGDYGRCHSMSLAQLVWQARGGAPLDRLSVSEVKTLFWHYRDRAELSAQLSDALEQIKQIGCVWVEQASAFKDDTIVGEEERL